MTPLVGGLAVRLELLIQFLQFGDLRTIQELNINHRIAGDIFINGLIGKVGDIPVVKYAPKKDNMSMELQKKAKRSGGYIIEPKRQKNTGQNILKNTKQRMLINEHAGKIDCELTALR